MYISLEVAYNNGYESFFNGGNNMFVYEDLKIAWRNGYLDAMVQDAQKQTIDFVDDIKVMIAYMEIRKAA
jgi:hypothetical protein